MTTLPIDYPPTHIASAGDSFNILQITDLHLCYQDNGQNTCNNYHDKYDKALKHALTEPVDYDLILVTGDMCNTTVDKRVYDYVFQHLEQTNIPFACIAGNHDVTSEIGEEDTPFSERELVPHEPDTRLLNQHVIETEYWQLLLLNSSEPGKVSGFLSPEDLQWLHTQLTNNTKPALIALHHHIVPMQSAWLDEHILKNADELWAIISAFDHVKIVTFGHVHQEFYKRVNNIDLYATPSTTYQFKPKQKDFAMDNEASSGYRVFTLNSDGTHTSEVRRVAI